MQRDDNEVMDAHVLRYFCQLFYHTLHRLKCPRGQPSFAFTGQQHGCQGRLHSFYPLRDKRVHVETELNSHFGRHSGGAMMFYDTEPGGIQDSGNYRVIPNLAINLRYEITEVLNNAIRHSKSSAGHSLRRPTMDASPFWIYLHVALSAGGGALCHLYF